MLIEITLLIIVVCLALKWGTKTFDFFEKQGIKYVKPYPFIGTSTWLFMRENIITIAKRYYDQFPNEKLYGLFNLREPFYVIRDPNLLKHLTIKESEYFLNHMNFIDFDSDEISSNMLILLRDEKWKQMRNALSPAFTSSKMRVMFDLISEVGQQMPDYFCEQYVKNGLVVQDVKDLFSRFTNDVIATCAFGIKCNSFRDPDNEFFQVGQQLVRFTKPMQMIKVLFVLFFRKLAKAMKLEIVPKKARKLFFTLIIENMKIREKEHIYRPDMIDLLLKLKKNELHHEGEDGKAESDTPAKTSWSEGELIAQCYIFFQAGFETTSGTLRFVAYQLATNPDAQAKLLKEIDQTHEKLAGKPLSYDNLSSLKYLEMVILETLRLWPPLFVTERQCGEEFHYKDDDGLQFKVPKGAFIWIPIQPLHMDAKYFPEPEKFKPERFEDKNEINSTGAYMPFGIGPRSCIGNRFALMEMKIALYYLLLKFTFEVCPETQIPAKLKNSMAGWVLQKEIKLYLKPRSEKLKDDSGSQ